MKDLMKKWMKRLKMAVILMTRKNRRRLTERRSKGNEINGRWYNGSDDDKEPTDGGNIDG